MASLKPPNPALGTLQAPVNARGETMTNEGTAVPRTPVMPASAQNIGQYGINWGTVVSDPNEQSRILGLATDFVNRNEAGGGGSGTYTPGFSREQAIRDAAYSFFPTFNGGGSSAGGGSGYPVGGGGGSVSGGSGSYTSGGGRFPGSAPSPTPYGNFTAPAVGSLSASGQRRIDQAMKAIQNSAAMRGTLLNTGTLQNLQENASGIASDEYSKDFDRATTAYGLNRGTNAQNFGQSMDQFRGNLDAWNTGDSSALNWANYGLRKDAAARDAMPEAAGPSVTSYGPAAADSYAQYVASLRQAQQPQSPLLPLATLADPYRRREYRGAGQ